MEANPLVGLAGVPPKLNLKNISSKMEHRHGVMRWSQQAAAAAAAAVRGSYNYKSRRLFWP